MILQHSAFWRIRPRNAISLKSFKMGWLTMLQMGPIFKNKFLCPTIKLCSLFKIGHVNVCINIYIKDQTLL